MVRVTIAPRSARPLAEVKIFSQDHLASAPKRTHVIDAIKDIRNIRYKNIYKKDAYSLRLKHIGTFYYFKFYNFQIK